MENKAKFDGDQLIEKFKEYYISRDKNIRNEIIEMNIPLVKYIVSKYLYDIKLDKKELISLGNIGLIRAVESYDYRLGVKFNSYASYCILNYIKNNLYTITDIKRARYNYPILKAIGKIEKMNGIKLDDNISEINEILDEDTFINSDIKDKVKKYLLTRDYEYNEESVNGSYEIEDHVIDNVLIEKMEQELDKLPVREREILRLRFGFYGKCFTIYDIGSHFNYTHQNISRIEKNVLKKLRSKLDCKL